jgi:ABC-type transport system involved in cytochrome c biogenesis permease subunit
MNQLIRNVGFGLIIVGILLVLAWAIEPVRMFWPWIRGLPLPLQIGFGAAVLGMAVLLSSLISERIRDREKDRELRDEF